MRRERWADLDVVITGGADRQGGGTGATVVLMHGFGAPGDDLVGMWRALEVPSDVRFVFPAAPLALPRQYMGGRAWWMIDVEAMQRAQQRGQVLDRSQDEPTGLDDAREQLVALLGVVGKELGAQPSTTVLGGFSQGAMLACDVAFRTQVGLAGLVLLSGTLIASRHWLPGMPLRKGIPVFQSHGRQDPLLPFSVAETLRDHLTGSGLGVTWSPFSGGHDIPFGVTQGVSAFLQRVAGGR